MRTFHAQKGMAFCFGTAFVLSAFPLAQAKPIKPAGFAPVVSEKVVSSTLGEQILEQEIHIDKPDVSRNSADCDIFDDPNSVACLGPAKGYQPTNNVERWVQKGVTYAARLVPMLNNGASGSDYADAIKSDGKAFLIGGINSEGNGYINDQIQKIPFFAQSSIAINYGDSEGSTSFSADSLMKLKEMATDDEGDLKTLLFSQAKFTTSGDMDGTTSNFGLGIRNRPNDESMLGVNVFLDYRTTDYSSAHSRIGLGGEYLWKDFEVRNNWYIASTSKKNVTIGGIDYTERVVPGWDVEVGYRFPDYPELAVLVRGFNWDYHNTQDNNGAEALLNWQSTPHVNVEAWVSNEISAMDAKANSALPDLDETFFGLRLKVTGQPVKFKKKNYKKNMITNMTQPVRRRNEVLLERSSGGWNARVYSE